MKRAGMILAALIVLAVMGGAALIHSGWYNIAATAQHTAPVYWLLEVAMRRSVVQHAEAIQAPPLDDPALIRRGLRLYEGNCQICHGAPGISPDAIALGMTPVPANLVLTAREWSAAELFWTIKHGIKSTGMPAWEFRLPDEDLWAIVAFVEMLPNLAPLAYLDLVRSVHALPAEIVTQEPALPHVPAGPGRGRKALSGYACGSCHEIPGIVGATKPVGPPLARIGTRKYIAGVLPNTPDNMVRWIRSPREINPLTAMPDLRVSERDARDMAAYLYTLR